MIRHRPEMSVGRGKIADVQTITAAAARRTALVATGFGNRRPSAPNRRHLAATLDRVQLLQLDSVNVAVRAHYMPLFSRLGPYPAGLLDDAAWSHSARKPRQLVEYWAHEASLIPPEDWPLLRWRMRRLERRYADDPDSIANTGTPGLAEKIVAAVEELGPIGAGELERALEMTAPRAKGPWWDRSEVKRACEWLFAIGELTTGTRRGFQRLYDLPERVLPAEVLARHPDDDVAFRELVRKSAHALGVATEPDLRDYYRLPPAASRTAVAELVDAGELAEVAVRGWGAPAYRVPETVVPRRIRACALLCPFDLLIWFRQRALRMFDFHYRIEIYTPEHKRVHGYYVFPLLLDDHLVARVDLKADRGAGVLRVHGAFAEDGVDHPVVAGELAGQLRSMATWLGLGDVMVGTRGDLISALRKEL